MFTSELGSLSKGFDITPADATELTEKTRAVMVEGAGVIAGVMTDGAGTTHTTNTLTAGILYPFEFQEIHSTGTSATGIKGYN